MRCRRQLILKALEIKNEEEYRLMLASDEDTLYPPWFFTWVEDNKLAAFAWPQTRGNLEFLWEQGIRHIVTLCPEKVPPLANSKFEWTFIPVKECHAPTIEDIFKFIRVVQLCRKKNQALGVHCRMGLGRTGVMVAIYLMYFHGMEAQQALRNLRYVRPGSVDSPAQEECILNYRPSARIANEKRIKKITRKGDHFLDILRSGGTASQYAAEEGEGMTGVNGGRGGRTGVTSLHLPVWGTKWEGVWGLPRIWPMS